MTLHFGEHLLWAMSIDELFVGAIFSAVVDISEYAGKEDALLFSLNSVGARNARFYVGNLAITTAAAPVPLPSTLGFCCVSVALLLRNARRRTSVQVESDRTRQ